MSWYLPNLRPLICHLSYGKHVWQKRTAWYHTMSPCVPHCSRVSRDVSSVWVPINLSPIGHNVFFWQSDIPFYAGAVSRRICSRVSSDPAHRVLQGRCYSSSRERFQHSSIQDRVLSTECIANRDLKCPAFPAHFCSPSLSSD